ncbi:hypothetical protein C7M84_025431 [Penaeus vannamei]|uniref:Uncharacterized protein n=1 Tax=Penaeus vannamei TaxID=6689 RepID=A0A423TY65_PENVA|nr:hypothetical protein C7M84_025431 [Penaeus vannamei]
MGGPPMGGPGGPPGGGVPHRGLGAVESEEIQVPDKMVGLRGAPPPLPPPSSFSSSLPLPFLFLFPAFLPPSSFSTCLPSSLFLFHLLLSLLLSTCLPSPSLPPASPLSLFFPCLPSLSLLPPASPLSLFFPCLPSLLFLPPASPLSLSSSCLLSLSSSPAPLSLSSSLLPLLLFFRPGSASLSLFFLLSRLLLPLSSLSCLFRAWPRSSLSSWRLAVRLFSSSSPAPSFSLFPCLVLCSVCFPSPRPHLSLLPSSRSLLVFFPSLPSVSLVFPALPPLCVCCFFPYLPLFSLAAPRLPLSSLFALPASLSLPNCPSSRSLVFRLLPLSLCSIAVPLSLFRAASLSLLLLPLGLPRALLSLCFPLRDVAGERLPSALAEAGAGFKP